MNIILTILSICILALFIDNQVIRYKRFKLINSLKRNYNEIEFFKPDFIIFFFKMLTYYTLYSGGNAIKKAIKDYGFIQTHDEAIAYSGMKVNVF